MRGLEGLGYTLKSNRRALVLRFALPMVAPDAAKSWIQIASEGEWKGHPSGPFQLTTKLFQNIAQEFATQVNPRPIDYNHSEMEPPNGQPKPAAGWIHDVQVRGDGLWALVEWTSLAAGMIRSGEYRFCSAVFLWNQPDRKTAEIQPAVLFNAALTNVPFLDGQKPITLSQRMGDKMNAGDLVQQICELLSLDPKSDADQITAAVEALTDLRDAQAGKAEVEPPGVAAAEPPDATPIQPVSGDGDKSQMALPIGKPKAAVPCAEPVAYAAPPGAANDPNPASANAATQELVAIVKDALGLPDGADAAAAIAALRDKLDMIKAAVGKAAPSGTSSDTVASQRVIGLTANNAALAANVTALTERVKAYEAAEAKAKEAEVDRRLDALITSGTILDAHRGALRKVALSTPALFEEMAKAFVPAVPVGEAAPPPAPKTVADKADLSDSDELAIKAFVLDGLPRDKAEAKIRAVKARRLSLVG